MLDKQLQERRVQRLKMVVFDFNLKEFFTIDLAIPKMKYSSRLPRLKPLFKSFAMRRADVETKLAGTDGCQGHG
jgi:hypothetical protein